MTNKVPDNPENTDNEQFDKQSITPVPNMNDSFYLDRDEIMKLLDSKDAPTIPDLQPLKRPLTLARDAAGAFIEDPSGSIENLLHRMREGFPTGGEENLGELTDKERKEIYNYYNAEYNQPGADKEAIQEKVKNTLVIVQKLKQEKLQKELNDKYYFYQEFGAGLSDAILKNVGDTINFPHDMSGYGPKIDYKQRRLDTGWYGFGDVAGEIVSFFGTFTAARKGLLALGSGIKTLTAIGTKAPKLTKYATMAASGSIADMVLHDPDEELLFESLLVAFEGNVYADELRRGIEDFTTAKTGEGKNRAASRFLAGFEGLGLGIAFDGILATGNAIRKKIFRGGLHRILGKDVSDPVIKEIEKIIEAKTGKKPTKKQAGEAAKELEVDAAERILKEGKDEPDLVFGKIKEIVSGTPAEIPVNRLEISKKAIKEAEMNVVSITRSVEDNRPFVFIFNDNAIPMRFEDDASEALYILNSKLDNKYKTAAKDYLESLIENGELTEGAIERASKNLVNEIEKTAQELIDDVDAGKSLYIAFNSGEAGVDASVNGAYKNLNRRNYLRDGTDLSGMLDDQLDELTDDALKKIYRDEIGGEAGDIPIEEVKSQIRLNRSKSTPADDPNALNKPKLGGEDEVKKKYGIIEKSKEYDAKVKLNRTKSHEEILQEVGNGIGDTFTVRAGAKTKDFSKQMQKLSAKFTAMRMLVREKAEELVAIDRKIATIIQDQGEDAVTDELLQELILKKGEFAENYFYTKQSIRDLARTFGSLKIKINDPDIGRLGSDSLKDLKNVQEELIELGKGDIKKGRGEHIADSQLRLLALDSADDDAVVDTLLKEIAYGGTGLSRNQVSSGSLFFGGMRRIYIGSILSGITTQTINFASSQINGLLYKPMSLALGSIMTGDPKGLVEVLGQYRSAFAAIPLAAKNFGKTWKRNRSVTDADFSSWQDVGGRNATKNPWGGFIKSETGRGAQNIYESALGFFVDLASGVERTMKGADDINKTIFYRMDVINRITSEAVQKYPNSKELRKAYIQNKVAKIKSVEGAYTEKSVQQAAQRAAQKQNLESHTKQFREFVHTYMNENYDYHLHQTSLKARDSARELTFTTPTTQTAQEGSIAGATAKAINDTIYAREQAKWFKGRWGLESIERAIGMYARTRLPFLTTPANLIDWFVNAVNPLPLYRYRKDKKMAEKLLVNAEESGHYQLAKKMKDQLESQDPMVRRLAYGRAAASVGIISTIYKLAADGLITDSGEQGVIGSEEYRAKGAANIRPNSSVWTPGGWVKYDRGDPLGIMFGFVAGVARLAADPDFDGDIDELLQAPVTLMAHYLNDRSYFTGVSKIMTELVGMGSEFRQIGDEEPTSVLGAVKDYAIDDLINAFPYANGLKGIADAQFADQTAKEMNGLMDQLIYRVNVTGIADALGIDTDFPDRYNHFGDTVNPKEILGFGSLLEVTGKLVDAGKLTAETPLSGNVHDVEDAVDIFNQLEGLMGDPEIDKIIGKDWVSLIASPLKVLRRRNSDLYKISAKLKFAPRIQFEQYGENLKNIKHADPEKSARWSAWQHFQEFMYHTPRKLDGNKSMTYKEALEDLIQSDMFKEIKEKGTVGELLAKSMIEKYEKDHRNHPLYIALRKVYRQYLKAAKMDLISNYDEIRVKTEVENLLNKGVGDSNPIAPLTTFEELTNKGN